MENVKVSISLVFKSKIDIVPSNMHVIEPVVALVNIYIYIYAFSRHFYPKRLTVHSGYTFKSVCVFPGNWTHNLLRC